MFMVNEFVVLLAASLVLNQALGTSTLFIAADNKRNLLWTAITITVFTTLASTGAYFVNILLPQSLTALNLLFYTIIIGVIYVLLLAVLYFKGRESFVNTRKYIHLSAFNCAVMGTVFTVSEKVGNVPSFGNFAGYVVRGAEAGSGFILAAFILIAAYRKLNSAKVPAAFRGTPAMLVYLGLISMAVYALK